MRNEIPISLAFVQPRPARVFGPAAPSRSILPRAVVPNPQQMVGEIALTPTNGSWVLRQTRTEE